VAQRSPVRSVVSGDRSQASETAALQIVFDGVLDRNTIGVRFVRQVVNSQTELLLLPSDWGGLGSLRCGLFRVVLDPLILPGAVADANKVEAVPGRFRPAAYCERSISPACSMDLLPLVDSLNCHLFSSLQGCARNCNCH
jgi:hypothetical protein